MSHGGELFAMGESVVAEPGFDIALRGYERRQVDRYVAWWLKRVLIKRKGRHLRAGQADQWTRQWLTELGLHQLMGTIRYPGAA